MKHLTTEKLTQNLSVRPPKMNETRTSESALKLPEMTNV